mmetsp:Transcript_1963/g.6168  ORF Transcript_1963/g.6168 Transcript_1963/m.6168 type:complete len:278 (+) Transcript_1963:176-1009(+)|eukprot:CAMPEP_0177650574 /NCGR_PEP_ID=MMETSP0447-20121125/12017_1 /TAXON_ID=0 /ORGANISM="Stygamoeba regulata, Strain BSH-02190019" /LENGTH=277 /DNA_ID=CAMNT_0019153457 /DNA_START=151 /DNA_END=984 /DNA_ORIENTATION=+
MTSAELKSDLLETLDNILSGDEGFRVQPNTVCDLLSDAMKERYDDMDEFDQQYQEMVKFFTLPRQIKYIKQEYKSRIAVMAESDCTQVFPDLFLSGFAAAFSKSFLQSKGITHIWNVASDITFKFIGGPVYVGKDLSCNALDGTLMDDILKASNTIYDEVKAAGGKLLIHGAFGNSRSASVVLALLMIRNKWSLNRAWEWLQPKRTTIYPSAGPMHSIRCLEDTLEGPLEPAKGASDEKKAKKKKEKAEASSSSSRSSSSTHRPRTMKTRTRIVRRC